MNEVIWVSGNLYSIYDVLYFNGKRAALGYSISMFDLLKVVGNEPFILRHTSMDEDSRFLNYPENLEDIKERKNGK